MDSSHLRGQSSLELIVAFGLVLLVFTVMVMFSSDKLEQTARLKEHMDAKRVGQSIRDNVNLISQQGTGYYTYFSIPEKIIGGYEYDVVFSESAVGLMWADSAWSSKLIESNVTSYCLSKGLTRKNRVLNEGDRLVITCHLPNIKVVPDTLQVDYNTSFMVENDAHVASGFFKVNLMDNESSDNVSISQLGPGEKVQLSFDWEAKDFANIYVDTEDQVNESIEEDNNRTWYL